VDRSERSDNVLDVSTLRVITVVSAETSMCISVQVVSLFASQYQMLIHTDTTYKVNVGEIHAAD